ncbi:unnamed protein product [Somion occarium]|uniref:BSD domain-containing protein n=1 Tax=Somion occarium TaxID=3059160 RepID=A0ABP1DIX6_9APHY
MNFLDTYDISTPTTPPAETQQAEQSLNEEVTQVVGQLSRFWGGFRKQSQAAFEAAKKDLTEVVSQAQSEITKLTSEIPTSTSTSEVTPRHTDETSTGEHIPETSQEESVDDTVTPEQDTSTSAGPSQSGHTRSESQNLFSRLQASLPPTLVSTIQSQLPEALKQPASIDFTQLRTTLTSEFQRVQGVTRSQAEEYVHKSESLLREAGEFLKEAVKVVPPEEGGSVAPAGALWDGTDIWMLPEMGLSSTTSKGKGKERERTSTSSGRPSIDGLRAVATRAEALLKQLKHDPEVLRVDPSADEKASKLFEAWKQGKVATKEGGIAGNEWQTAIQAALDDAADREALKATIDTLDISEQEFWTRYFFRVHQVEQEEERRKALIQGTIENEEDFSWEDDEDEATSPTTAKPKLQDVKAEGIERSSDLAGSLSTLKATSDKPDDHLLSPDLQDSRRQSSEDSYDVVSSQVSTNGETKVERTEKDKGSREDDADSDWE